MGRGEAQGCTNTIFHLEYLPAQRGLRATAVRTTAESEMRFLGKRLVLNSSVFV